MQIENDYDKEVYNGDIAYIDDVDNNAGEIVASFDGRSVTYGFGELDMLVPAYAATIHKSQGSEYPAVIIRAHSTLRHAAAESSLHRRHTRQATGGPGGAEKGRRNCSAQRFGPPAVVEAGGMAATWSTPRTDRS
jgi:hypothetical protein